MSSPKEVSKTVRSKAAPSANAASSPKHSAQPIAFNQAAALKARRRILRESSSPSQDRDRAFRVMILSIPPGKVCTYGQVAAAAGYPLYHRAVARLLRTDPVDQLPWHRVIGAGGEIKLPSPAAEEQRARLLLEGVSFRGNRVEMERSAYAIKTWEAYR